MFIKIGSRIINITYIVMIKHFETAPYQMEQYDGGGYISLINHTTAGEESLVANEIYLKKEDFEKLIQHLESHIGIVKL